MATGNWNSFTDREKYYELIKKPTNELTLNQLQFIKSMYHQEEYYTSYGGNDNEI